MHNNLIFFLQISTLIVLRILNIQYQCMKFDKTNLKLFQLDL